jgi:hypothetical protein
LRHRFALKSPKRDEEERTSKESLHYKAKKDSRNRGYSISDYGSSKASSCRDITTQNRDFISKTREYQILYTNNTRLGENSQEKREYNPGPLPPLL